MKATLIDNHMSARSAGVDARAFGAASTSSEVSLMVCASRTHALRGEMYSLEARTIAPLGQTPVAIAPAIDRDETRVKTAKQTWATNPATLFGTHRQRPKESAF